MRSLAAALGALLLAVPLGARAQSARRVAAPAPLLSAPNGRPIAELRAGARVVAQAASGTFTQVVVEGFVEPSSLGGPRGSFAVHVTAPRGALLRAVDAPDGEALALLMNGMGLASVPGAGKWTRVRRAGWVSTASLEAAPTIVAASSAPPSAPPAAARKPELDAPGSAVPRGAPAPVAAPPVPTHTALAPAANLLEAGRRATVRSAPDGRAVATVEPRATMTPLARERGWVRVRLEGWVPDADVLPADTALRSGLGAADLRADPAGTRGRVVRWEVEVLAFQTADPLRRDLAPDEPYLLARGPGAETALLYLAVPPSLLNVARSLPPLAPVTIVARVRNGRSRPVGVPILDLQTITRR